MGLEKEMILDINKFAKVEAVNSKFLGYDQEDKDIVIGMLQSLSQKTYDMKAFESFGLSIYDECHHLSAEVFS